MISYVLPSANRTVKQDIGVQVRGSKLDNKLIKLLEANAEFFRVKLNFNYQPAHYITLDQIVKMTPEISEIHDSLVRLTDVFSSDDGRIAYPYAYLIEENHKAIVKICLLRPPSEKQGYPRDAARMCQKAVEFSIPVLEKIIKARSSRLLKVPAKNPEHLLVKNITTKKKIPESPSTQRQEVYANTISFEAELHKLILTGFRLSPPVSQEDAYLEKDEAPQQRILNIKPIPIPHLLFDWIKYLRDHNLIISIIDNYYVVNNRENPSLLPQEIRKHILVHKETLKKVILPRIHRIVVDSSTVDYNDAYNTWKEYSGNLSNTDFVEEAGLILKVMNAVHLDDIDQTQIGLSLENISRSVEILTALLERLDVSSDVKMNKLVQNIRSQIEYNSENRKLLSMIDLCDEFSKMGRASVPNDVASLKNLFEKLSDKFAYLVKSGELTKPQDFQEIYFVEPSRLTGIIAHLAKLALKNKVFQEQYKVAKMIKKNLLNDIKMHPELDAKMTLSEISEAGKTIEEFDKILNFEKRRKIKSAPQEYDFAKGFLLSTLYVGGIFTLAILSNPYSIMLLITYPILAKFLFSKGSSEKDKITKEKVNSNVQPDLKQQIQKYIKNNLSFENSKTGGIGPPQIMTYDQLEDFLDFADTNNITKIEKAFPDLKKQSPAQIKDIFKSAFMEGRVIITFKETEIPQAGSYLRQKGVSFPKELYITQTSLANPVFRQGLSDFLRKEFEMLTPTEKDKQMYYRKLIEILENPREYTKYLKNR